MSKKSILLISAVVFLVCIIATLAITTSRWLVRDRSAFDYNVLLITLDTTRADHLSCYGYTRKTSPNLDALAADGVRFDMALSTSAVTPISHASILTGLNPYQHGLRVFYGPTGHFLSKSFPTIATILKLHGWDTGAFISAYPASERFGLNWGFDTFETDVTDSVMTQDPRKRLPKDGFLLRQRTASAQRRADATTDQALKWLKNIPRPFFIWVHYFDPHDPSLIPPIEITERFGVSLTDRRDVAVTIYDPEIFFMDMQLGRLLDYLKQIDEYDHTVIVAVGDHGQGLGQHNWFQHRLLYQEQIRLPLIMRLPRGERGQVVSELVRSIDLMPTILEAVGLEATEPIEGVSLVGLVNGREEGPQFAYSEALNTIDVHAPRKLPPHQKDDLFCLTDGTWKLIYHKNNPQNTELYNLLRDPKELNNLVTLHPEKEASLVAALKGIGAMEVELVEPGVPMEQEALQKLRSLGYVGESD